MDDFEACIAHLRFPVTHQRAIRTTNFLERLFVEERGTPFGERAVLKLMLRALIRAVRLVCPNTVQPMPGGRSCERKAGKRGGVQIERELRCHQRQRRGQNDAQLGDRLCATNTKNMFIMGPSGGARRV